MKGGVGTWKAEGNAQDPSRTLDLRREERKESMATIPALWIWEKLVLPGQLWGQPDGSIWKYGRLLLSSGKHSGRRMDNEHGQLMVCVQKVKVKDENSLSSSYLGPASC